MTIYTIMMLSRRRLAQSFLFLTALISLVTCPHSKVEESFPLQATHDLFYFGLGPALQHVTSSSTRTRSSRSNANEQQQHEPTVLPYDHLQFPGVVPRSFIGPYILALMCQCVRRLLLLLFFFVVNKDNDENDYYLDLAQHPMVVQFLARFILMMLSLHGWYRLADAADFYHYHYQCQKTASSSSLSTTSIHQTTMIGNYLLLVAACQFHMPFYASRMLPNTFATIVCMHAFASWMYGNVVMSAVGLVVSTAVFRCDVLLLLFVTGLIWLLYPPRPLGPWQAIRIGMTTGAVCLACTVPLDSLLWQRFWVWPEGEVFYFNTILGKSSDWGVSAWHWYWTVAIPKSMLLTVLFVPFSIIRLPERLDFWERCYLHPRDNDASNNAAVVPISIVDTEWFPFILSAFGFVSLYSCLGHKEMRFLFPVMPLWNLAAAVGMSRFHSLVFTTIMEKNKRDEAQQHHRHQHQPKRTMIALLGLSTAMLALVLSLAASWSFVAVSRWNYPGGVALQHLQDHVVTSVAAHHGGNANDGDHAATVVASLPSLKVHVYIDVASAMTGVSLFGQHAAKLSTKDQAVVWSFDKKGYESENASVDGRQWSTYTHILTEDPDLMNDTADERSLFQRVGTIQGNPRLDWRNGGRIVTSNAIYILEQKDWIKNRIMAEDSSNTVRAHHDQRQVEQEDFAQAPGTARIEL